MHAFLIHAGTKEARIKRYKLLLKTWNIAPIDTIFLSKDDEMHSIGITEVRAFQKQLTLTPYTSSHSVGIITEGELLTKEAQHALLKTLEEPPPKAKLIILAEQSELLLPTILSRCHVLQEIYTSISEEQKQAIDKILSEVPSKKPGEIIHYVDTTFPSKEAAANFIHNLLLILSEKNISDSSFCSSFSSYKTLIRQGLLAQARLTANVHYAMTLDTFFITSLARQANKVYVQ